MAETAAHLVEHMLPEQPIRQWVLSFRYPLRFLFGPALRCSPKSWASSIRSSENDGEERGDELETGPAPPDWKRVTSPDER